MVSDSEFKIDRVKQRLKKKKKPTSLQHIYKHFRIPKDHKSSFKAQRVFQILQRSLLFLR